MLGLQKGPSAPERGVRREGKAALAEGLAGLVEEMELHLGDGERHVQRGEGVGAQRVREYGDGAVEVAAAELERAEVLIKPAAQPPRDGFHGVLQEADGGLGRGVVVAGEMLREGMPQKRVPRVALDDRAERTLVRLCVERAQGLEVRLRAAGEVRPGGVRADGVARRRRRRRREGGRTLAKREGAREGEGKRDEGARVRHCERGCRRHEERLGTARHSWRVLLLVLWVLFVRLAGGTVGARHARVIPRDGGSGVTVWRNEGERDERG